MSGRKQHYIPQCLLRGFETVCSGKESQVVVFKRGRAPYTASIKDVAAQRNFYSELSDDGRKTLDDHITEYENRLGPLLTELRAVKPGERIDSSRAAEVVAHLTVRAAFVRELFTFGARELLSITSQFLSDGEAVRQYLGIDNGELDTALSEEIDKAIDQLRITFPDSAARGMLKRIFTFSLRESFTEFHENSAGKFAPIMNSIDVTLPVSIRDAHAKALSSSVAPDPRIEALATLKWTSISVEPHSHFILPDCIALSRVKGTEAEYVPYLLHSNDELETVLLPFSSAQILIGSRDAVVQEIDSEEVNRAAAECAFDFFVSSTGDEKTFTISKNVGAGSRATVLDTVHESLLSLRPSKDKYAQPEEGSESEWGSQAISNKETGSHSYVVSFLDCADQSTAEQIADVVRIVVNALGARMPVQRIESITFASDYKKALAAVDRGFESNEPLSPTSVDYGVGVAMAPMVLRDRGIRCCIVMQSWLGHALLSVDDEKIQLTAIYTLATMVARAAYIDMVDTALPGILLKPLEDPWDAFFIKHIESVSSSYFSARVVADIDPDLGGGYQDLFCNALRSAIEVIPSARLEYRTHGNLDLFLRTALAQLSDVLTHAAALIGHFDALGLSVTEYDETKGLLVENGLLKWMDVYQRDLEAIYDCRSQWSSLTEFLSLTVHVERLLWQFGIFPWKTEDSQIRIEIPLESDMAALLSLVSLAQSGNE